MENLMTFNEAKKYLKVSRPTLYRIVNNKKIPAFKVGGQWRFRRDRLNKWMEENENMNKK